MRVSTALVSRHLDETLASPLFRKAERQARFLRYVVDTTLSSPEVSIKEFEIGLAVYDRRPDYDPRADPIVRVEAARLRARLREHYENSPPEHVKIELPKGGYVPLFVSVQEAESPTETPARTPSTQPDPSSVTLQRFRSLSSNDDDNHFCDGLTEETLHRLAQDSNVRVIGRQSFARAQGAEAPLQTRYLLEGSVRRAGDQIRVSLHLVDVEESNTRLSKVYQEALHGDVFTVQENLAAKIHADVADALSQDLRTAAESEPVADRP